MWDKVKDFIGDSAPVIGTLLGGPAGGATGSLVASWLGEEDDPAKVLERLQTNPKALVEIKRMESEERQQLRQLEYKAAELKTLDNQHQHEQQQETIRSGDNAEDEYVRRTRPKMARMSFYSGVIYLFLFELLAAFDKGDGANEILLGTLFSPALAYMGFRTVDAFSKYKGSAMGKAKSGISGVVNSVKGMAR